MDGSDGLILLQDFQTNQIFYENVSSLTLFQSAKITIFNKNIPSHSLFISSDSKVPF